MPACSQLYAQGNDQYPEFGPGFIARGHGCHVWDVDGHEYIEYGMGLRAVTLGHGYRPVVDAAYRAMLNGMNFTRPSPLEVECAETLIYLIPQEDVVKLAATATDVTPDAV